MAGILLEESSPFGNVFARIDDDDRVVYFYLYFRDLAEDDSRRMRTCWVRNRVPAPPALNRAAMVRGQPPLMPAAHCVHPGAGRPFDPANLRIVWSEECDGAALLERDQLLAIIPSWSGEGDFSGYARDCIGEGPFAWELEPGNVMHERIRAAQDFWRLWDNENFWPQWRDERIAALEAVLGPHAKYYAIDGGEFPPRALLRFDAPDWHWFVTVGVSLFCQPGVERYFENPSPYRRMELAAAVDRRCSDAESTRVGHYISAQARYPWHQFAPLGQGHTMPCDSTPGSCGGKAFDFVLFWKPRLTPQIELPAFRGDPINVLWMLPISQRERDIVASQGSETLAQQLEVAGGGIGMRKRAPLYQ